MPRYKYKALKDNKIIVDGEVDALNMREAREKVRLLGFIPTKVYTENSQNDEISQEQLYKRRLFLSLTQKISFTRELQTMLSAGIPILEALHNVKVNSNDDKLKTLASELIKSIKNGHSFAESLSMMYGKTFGSVYTTLVETGENSGDLEIALDRMLTILRKQDSIKCRIINASIYPCVLLAIMYAILVLFAKYVFPAFASVMVNNGVDIPVMAQNIMGTMNFIGNFWWLILLGGGSLGYLFITFCKNSDLKRFFDKFVLKIPVLSEFAEYINLSNFMTVLYISYDAGLPAVSCLELANKTVGNCVIKSKINNVIKLIQKGNILSDALQWSKAIPGNLISMISAGEKSGTLGKMFKDASEVIDKKVDMTLEALSRLFEPTVIIILGIVVAIIVFAYMQMYSGMLGSLF